MVAAVKLEILEIPNDKARKNTQTRCAPIRGPNTATSKRLKGAPRF